MLIGWLWMGFSALFEGRGGRGSGFGPWIIMHWIVRFI